MSSYAEMLFDADVRIECLFWIPSIAGSESSPSSFDEFSENLPEDQEDALYVALPMLKSFASASDYPSAEDVAERLMTVEGFLLQGATPNREYFGADGNMWLSGWGYYRTCWIYAPSEAEIATSLIAWAEALHEAEKAKWLAERSKP